LSTRHRSKTKKQQSRLIQHWAQDSDQRQKNNNPDSFNIGHKTQIKDKTKQNNTTQTTKNMTCPHQKTTGVNRGSHKKGMQFLFLIKSEKRLVGDGENKTMYLKVKTSVAI
jgi:hypothetical protein